jgi:glucosamine--fructose-6-phosphate aminotransferase (isomerizing)
MSTQMEKEVKEQPEAIARTLEASRGPVEALCKDIRGREITYVTIAARGTSDNAGRYAKYILPAFNGLPVALTTPSLFTFYKKPPRLKNVLVLGISQSGQSEDIVEVLKTARAQGALTAAITTDPSSPLAATAQHTLPLASGLEKAVAATKTFTSSLALLAQLSVTLDEEKERRRSLEALPKLMGQACEMAEKAVAPRAERYRFMDRCVVIARGYSYAIAFEIALKLKELTYVTALPYSSADFLHGPMAIVEPGFPVIVIVPKGELYPHLKEFTEQLAARSAELLVISNSEEVLRLGEARFPIPDGVPEWLAPVLSVVPGQFLALNLSLAKGIDPDKPRGLKKVTVTR